MKLPLLFTVLGLVPIALMDLYARAKLYQRFGISDEIWYF
ncbi:MAG: hypothetical protein RLZZ416_792 [Candidatus Parcubacteria bacterium]|jgi:hypothetical protein